MALVAVSAAAASSVAGTGRARAASRVRKSAIGPRRWRMAKTKQEVLRGRRQRLVCQTPGDLQSIWMLMATGALYAHDVRLPGGWTQHPTRPTVEQPVPGVPSPDIEHCEV
jgi:hypothetical protein